jgi:hypothetical protein
MSEERGEYLTGEPLQIVKCPTCEAVIGAVVEYQGERYLAVGGVAMLQAASGLCVCGAPFRWRAPKGLVQSEQD